MYIISVYLIAATAPHRELTYFSAERHEPGEIVPLRARGKISYGLVSKCESARVARQEVRSAGFSLQKITGTGAQILTKPLLHAVFETAAHQAASAGAVLSALVPAPALEHLEKLEEPDFGRLAAKPKPQQLCIAPRALRSRHYRDLAYAAHEKAKSVLIIAPTIVEAERIADNLPHALLFHGDLGKKKLIEAWNTTARAKRPVVVVGTYLALSAPRDDWGVIVLERVLARGYERSNRPFLNVRACAEKIAAAYGAQLVIGSPIAPIEDWKIEDGGQWSPKLAAGAWHPSPPVLIDMRQGSLSTNNSQLPTKSKFELFSAEAKGHIATMLAEQKNVLLVTARHGLAPHTTCDDCGTPLSCPRCSSGLVLHEERQPQRISLMEAYMKRWFECHYCGFTENVNILCPVCGSWRLGMHGIGIALVAREAEKQFPKAKLLVADDEAAGRPSAAKKLAARFRESKGAVLAATESMLAYMHEIPLAVVVSVDSMLYVPEYSAPERALAFLMELRGLSDDVLLQTRVPEHPVIAALSGKGDFLDLGGVTLDLNNFYERELELRKKFKYPPYATLIRFSVSGTKDRQKQEADSVMKALEPFQPLRFPARSKRGSIVREHMLIKLPAEAWIDPKLLAFIRSLPPSVEVRVNPKNVLSD